MTKRLLVLAALMLTGGVSLAAQDLVGTWQGSIGGQLRVIVRVTKTGDRWSAMLSSIDQSPDWGSGIPADEITVDGGHLKFAISAVKGSFDGVITADGNNIDGSWTQLGSGKLILERARQENAWKDPSPHQVQMVKVDDDIQLEVLDWGGTGRPLVFLAGLGNTAHIFDKFAPKFVGGYHVYGITRRGFGASSSPASGYSSDRLGDDILAVLDSLKIDKPVLVGHSIAGEELSSIGSRHPEKVTGLIYLDAAYFYAFDDGSSDIPRFDATPAPPTKRPLPSQQIQAGERAYKDIHGPILAIYAEPHDVPSTPGMSEADRDAAAAKDAARVGAQSKAFEKGLPSAHVVRLPHANHYVFISNESDVLKEMAAFLSGLSK